jgi:mannose-6-phosphate isomerase-like protein (cupin superfamily)
MIIDFEKTEEKVVENFKGGNGTLIMRAADDGKVKIMRNTLTAGSSIGMHTHEGNSEVMYIIKGEITFVCDGKEETVHAGEVHYCPCGHTHSAENRTAEDAEFFAIVPETKL